jgi:hypothetical protein
MSDGEVGWSTSWIERSIRAVAALICCSGCVPQEESEGRNGFFESRVQVVCEKNAECCHGNESVEATRKYCLDSTADLEKLGFNLDRKLEAALSSGKVAYDESARDACYGAIRALSCADWQHAVAGAPIEPCTRIFVGKLPNGDECGNYFECASQFCDSPSSGTRGTCKTKGVAGAACTDAHDMSCADGLDCSIVGQVEPTCVARGELGAECTRSEQCYSQICEAGACTEGCWANPLSHQTVGI